MVRIHTGTIEHSKNPATCCICSIYSQNLQPVVLSNENNSQLGGFVAAPQGSNCERFYSSINWKEVTDEVRELLALPARLEGLGIFIPTWKSDDKYAASTTVTKPLVASIINKEPTFDVRVEAEQKEAKNKVQLQQKAKSEQEAADVRLKILGAVYRSQERGKCRQYEEQIREAEMSSFTPLVFLIFVHISGIQMSSRLNFNEAK